MRFLDKFSDFILFSAISLVIAIVVILAGLFGYILVRNIIEKRKGKGKWKRK